MKWPYTDMEPEDLETALVLAAQIIQKLGAEYIGDSRSHETWLMGDGQSVSDMITQKVFRFHQEFVRIDRVYLPDCPCIVLEFSDQYDGPYEDADPFPFHLGEKEFEQKIRYSMGLDSLQ